MKLVRLIQLMHFTSAHMNSKLPDVKFTLSKYISRYVALF